jgi:transposase
MQSSTFTVKAYSKKELMALYNVGEKTFRNWVKNVVNLGSYDGRKYTPLQVQKIVDHLGAP